MNHRLWSSSCCFWRIFKQKPIKKIFFNCLIKNGNSNAFFSSIYSSSFLSFFTNTFLLLVSPEMTFSNSVKFRLTRTLFIENSLRSTLIDFKSYPLRWSLVISKSALILLFRTQIPFNFDKNYPGDLFAQLSFDTREHLASRWVTPLS